MVNKGLHAGARALIEQAQAVVAQATAEPLPPARPALIIRTEAEAREWLGADHGLAAFFRPGPAVAVFELPGAGGGVLPPLTTVTVDALPHPEPAAPWHRIELSHDPQSSPPLACRVDGEAVELEQHLDGVWRPRRTETDG